MSLNGSHAASNGFENKLSIRLPALFLLELLSKRGRRLSELLHPLETKYYISGEINSTVADPAGRMRALADHYYDAEQYNMDGISVIYPDWHFNVRTSNTEPLLRLNLEALSRADMERRRDEVLAILRG